MLRKLFAQILVYLGYRDGLTSLTSSTDTKMDPYLTELFARPDDFQLVDKIYVRISETCDGSDLMVLERLPREHRVVLDVWGSGGIIGNGGFRYLFAADLVDFPGMVNSYEAIGVSQAAKAFRDALWIFPDSKPPADNYQRLEYLDELGPGAADKLQQISAEMWACDRQVKRSLAEYVRANQEAFTGLRPNRWENISELKQRDLPPPPAGGDEKKVIRWLQSIDVGVQRWNEAYHEVRQTAPLPTGNPIIALRLSAHRNSTDSDLEQMTKCQALNLVREITLDETFVSIAGLSLLAKFPELRILSLAETDVTDDQLAILSSHSRLESLNLSKTQVTNAGLKRLQGMHTLRNLDLSETRVEDAGLEHLALLKNLRSLELRGTSIRGPGLASLSQLPLERLALMEAAVTDDGLRSLSELRQLKNLELRDTTIGDRSLAYLNKALQLEDLDLSGTQVTDEGLVHLAGLAKLQSLSLSVTAIDGRGLKHLENLTQLHDLHLFKTQCNDQGVQFLSKLRSLRSLWMGETRTTDACLASLSQLTGLEKLGIDDPGIQGGPELRRLENLKSLQWISLPKHLQGNPNLRYLQKKMPKTEFSL